MPKDRRDRSLSHDQSKVSPYHCSLNNAEKYSSKIPSLPNRDEKEWEEAICPVCMEHPHNAVLLLCSSSEKGCRPFICDTSYRHSNCLDQFCKSSRAAQSEALPHESSGAHCRRIEERMSRGTTNHGRLHAELVCPLCRGQITGWVVIETARRFMNSKKRSCSLETCGFNGNYFKLRKHARHEHPSVRPSEADPSRQRDWMALEHQRDIEDLTSQLASWGDSEMMEDAVEFNGFLNPDLWGASVDVWLSNGFDELDNFLEDTLNSIFYEADDYLGSGGSYLLMNDAFNFPSSLPWYTGEVGNAQSDNRRSTRSGGTSHPSARRQSDNGPAGEVGSAQPDYRRSTRSRGTSHVEAFLRRQGRNRSPGYFPGGNSVAP